MMQAANALDISRAEQDEINSLLIEHLATVVDSRKGELDAVTKAAETGENVADVYKATRVAAALHSAQAQLDAALTFQTRGVEFRSPQEGVFIVRNGYREYWYWPSSGKWRPGGKAKIYRSKSVVQFIDRFVLRLEEAFNV